MGHCIQIIVAEAAVAARLVQRWPGATTVALPLGYCALPLTEPLYDALAAALPPGAADAGDVRFARAPDGVGLEFAAASREVGPLAYLETNYFGGAGSQVAGAWRDGEVRALEYSTHTGPIDAALRVLGVTPAPGQDAFDALGLGAFRHMDEFDPPPPAPAASAGPGARTDAFPTWLVLLVIAAAVTLGVLVGRA
jgi:hypothetical protein